MTFVRALFALIVVSSACAGSAVRAESGAPLTLAADPAQPHLLVLRQQGAGLLPRLVAADAAADARILDARDALAARAAGTPLKVVYVLARDAGRFEVLAVRESLLVERAGEVARLVGAFEQARQSIVANPAHTATLVSAAEGALAGRDFSVARPGPALEQALAAHADRAQVHALIDDGPLREAARGVRAADAARFAGLRQ